MNMTTIMSMKRIEVFGPNKSKVILNKDEKIQTVKQDWNKKGKNRVQINIGQQEVPTECLEWAMIKSMIAAKIITVGTSTVVKKTAAEKKAEKEAKAAAKAEADAAAKLAEKAEEGHIPSAK
jgi:hypothetical protein